ncbi:hypothetical protein EMUR_03720 [Ehrlichia muris AS145]|uniref:Uncharacterized protein n=1 Tax=Ehrlichia muris AS145 TaxID=1423892 RepID=V9R8V6_9RICK|nr:hypothetical protein EMUR_03720 [Ehrlichia muris AS145]
MDVVYVYVYVFSEIIRVNCNVKTAYMKSEVHVL